MTKLNDWKVILKMKEKYFTSTGEYYLKDHIHYWINNKANKIYDKQMGKRKLNNVITILEEKWKQKRN